MADPSERLALGLFNCIFFSFSIYSRHYSFLIQNQKSNNMGVVDAGTT